MRDNDLFIFLRAALQSMLPARGIEAVIKQSYQPTQRGRPEGNAIFLHKIMDRRHGSRAVREAWDKDALEMRRTETQVIETTIQFNALAAQRDPADDAELTAADLLKAVAACLQSADFIARAKAVGVQVLRIQEIQSVTIENDRDQFEYSPSFDAVFTHTDCFTQSIQAIDRFDLNLRRV